MIINPRESGVQASPVRDDLSVTPCVQLCWLDPVTGLCDGCGRTLDEIARWASLDAAGRRAIMDDLPRRRAGAAAALDRAEDGR